MNLHSQIIYWVVNSVSIGTVLDKIGSSKLNEKYDWFQFLNDILYKIIFEVVFECWITLSTIIVLWNNL